MEPMDKDRPGECRFGSASVLSNGILPPVRKSSGVAVPLRSLRFPPQGHSERGNNRLSDKHKDGGEIQTQLVRLALKLDIICMIWYFYA